MSWMSSKFVETFEDDLIVSFGMKKGDSVTVEDVQVVVNEASFDEVRRRVGLRTPAGVLWFIEEEILFDPEEDDGDAKARIADALRCRMSRKAAITKARKAGIIE